MNNYKSLAVAGEGQVFWINRRNVIYHCQWWRVEEIHTGHLMIKRFAWNGEKETIRQETIPFLLTNFAKFPHSTCERSLLEIISTAGPIGLLDLMVAVKFGTATVNKAIGLLIEMKKVKEAGIDGEVLLELTKPPK